MSGRRIARRDLTGMRFGHLVAVSDEYDDTRARFMWACKCDCGKIARVRGSSLTSGGTISCGCQRGKNGRHHATRSPEHRAFLSAKARCTRASHQQFRNYGARGIECRFPDFESFLSHIGPRPTRHHSLDRIDNDGHYEAGNVRWALPETQANNKRTNRRISHEGRRLTLAQWARLLGVPVATIKARAAKGWSARHVLATHTARREA